MPPVLAVPSPAMPRDAPDAFAHVVAPEVYPVASYRTAGVGAVAKLACQGGDATTAPETRRVVRVSRVNFGLERRIDKNYKND